MTQQFRNEYTKKINDAAFSELSQKEVEQLLTYLWIFISEDLDEHWEVNEYITNNDIWDDFSELRSLNDHGYKNRVKGITPKYFAIACTVLDVDADDGAPLEDYKKY